MTRVNINAVYGHNPYFHPHTSSMNRLYRALILVELALIGISIFSSSARIPALIGLQTSLTLSACLTNFNSANRGSRRYIDTLDGSLTLAIFTPVFIAVFTPYYILSALCLIEALVVWSTVVQVKEYLHWRTQHSPTSPVETIQPKVQTASLEMAEQKPVEQAA